jgi:hypothetical protein
MKRTSKVVAGFLVAGVLAMSLALPQAVEAGGYHGHYHSNPAGYFVGGLAVGAVTGLVVGSLVAPPVYAPPVVYPPAPVVVQPAPVVLAPAPVCSSYWVNPYWNGYQWVPGYWAQACR